MVKSGIAEVDATDLRGTQKGERRADFRKVKLTRRDLEILKFILEMKFASLDEIHWRFFRTLENGQESQSNVWADQRLRQLCQAGFLERTRSFSESVSLYLVTSRGHRALLANQPNYGWVRPSGAFDLRTFDHDRFVLRSRLELEQRAGIVDWISDRRLKLGLGNHFGLTADSVPDAIYKMHTGEWRAFELELTQKSRKRYREKVWRFERLIRERAHSGEMFRKVHFRCLKDSISKAIQEEVRLFPDLFEIEFITPSALELGGAK